MKMFTVLSTVVIGLALITALGLLCAYPTMWMVNYLFTAQLLSLVFGASKIGFWQAFILNVLIGWFSRGSSSKSDG